MKKVKDAASQIKTTPEELGKQYPAEASVKQAVVEQSSYEEEEENNVRHSMETIADLDEFLHQSDIDIAEAEEEERAAQILVIRVEIKENFTEIQPDKNDSDMEGKCLATNMNLAESDKHKSIIDSGADSTIAGRGWHVVEVHPHRRANVTGFDSDAAVKRNLPIVTAITAVETSIDGPRILIRTHETVYNESSEHTLLSDHQLRKCVHKLDCVPKQFGGDQIMMVTEDLGIPLTLQKCMMTFEHSLPTKWEMDNLKIHDITLDLSLIHI